MEDTEGNARGGAYREGIDAANAAIAACLDHALDLLSAAHLVREADLPHIAYHLATLALEEVGKSELIGIRAAPGATEDTRTWVAGKWNDHVGKLFLALWGPSFGREKVTNEQIHSARALANRLHETRLRGLYFDVDSDEVRLPREAVPAEDADRVIRLAQARVDLAKSARVEEVDEETLADILWFGDAAEDPTSSRLILGSKSMEKLAELGEPRLWMRWLRRRFEEAEARGREALEQELRRPPPGEGERWDPKWNVKVRFYTNSHSIRPKALNWWNDTCNWIKLTAAGRTKQELIVEFLLPNAISVEDLWWAGWGVSRQFAVALNIGTMGYFWWYVPEQISRFYERLVDLEGGASLTVERSPMLRLDWRRDAVSEQDLKNTALCLSMMPGRLDRDKHEPFTQYATGLTHLSKNDVHMQFEASAYLCFYRALKAGMHLYGDWDGAASFGDAFDAAFSELMHDDQERGRYVSLGEESETAPHKPEGITLSEAGMMKLLCDAYFLRTFRRLGDERVAREASETPDDSLGADVS